MKQLPGNAFLFFVAACFLGMLLPAGLAANKTQKQKNGETFVQQIGPANGEMPLDIRKVYSIVPAGKPLRTSTQFKVVDDFNAGELKNSLGGAWSVDNEGVKKVQLELKKDDARGTRSGASLWARYNLKKKDQVTIRTALEKLDISAAHYLVLQCKTDSSAPFKGRLRIALTDWSGKTVERDITDVCLEAKGWNEVVCR